MKTIKSRKIEPSSTGQTILERLDLENFRAFQSLSLDFRKITILAGANSSGKTAALSAIAVALQTRDLRQFPFELSLNGENCALGGYRDVVHSHNTKLGIGISVHLSQDEKRATIQGQFRYAASGEHIVPKAVHFATDEGTLDVEWRGHEDGYYSKFAFRKIGDDAFMSQLLQILRAVDQTNTGTKARKLATTASRKRTGSLRDKVLPDSQENAIRKLFAVDKDAEGKWRPITRGHKDIQDKLKVGFATPQLLESLRTVWRAFRMDFAYVAPIRAYPSRFYALQDQNSRFDPSGRFAAQTLNRWQRNNPELLSEMLEILRKLQLIDHGESETPSDDIIRLFVQPAGHRDKRNIADVGFGVSQVLPVIVEDVGLGKTGTLVANQPEVHLHPSAQARLADYFASRLEKRRYIVETHSEYLINRLRLLVAKGVLPESAVVVHYFHVDKQGKHHHSPIEIKVDGSLSGAPKEFFDTYAIDAFAIAMAGLNSKTQKELVAKGS